MNILNNKYPIQYQSGDNIHSIIDDRIHDHSISLTNHDTIDSYILHHLSLLNQHDMHELYIEVDTESMSDTIGDIIQLNELIIESNILEYIPDSISKLTNLESLF